MARDLAYYRAEHARHPGLHATGIMFDDAREMIRRFAREYGMPPVSIEHTSGNRASSARGSFTCARC